ncbi:ABC transporter ATP-binding protein [Halorussus sp. MSC15.2]|uniref:ABC transporter ATP-binding protein n=1 Tax=Halorussus sp. MSC15.2 TaxID=2283638 RepID=UPI0013D05025|nr:ABC transporter ATP-binding protein [Halorussus sp. MSC15.2]NEU55566.1 ABC transporter ATP-binding protein [Halorussus sp. MSC15.2]
MRSSPAIRVENLRKEYETEHGSITAVDDVSFDIESGSVVGLLGPNGAGKTTTIKCLLGLVKPTAGQIEVEGENVRDNQRATYQHVTSMLEGARNIYWRLTVMENIAYFLRHQGIKPADVSDYVTDLLEAFDIEQKADEPVRKLSRGMKQKAALVCALAQQTPVVVLDEPTLGLDVTTASTLRTELRRLVDEENRTVLLSSHDMDSIQELCDRVIIMSEGQILAEERIEDLLDMFRTQAYVFLVENGPSEETRRTLESRYQVNEWRERGKYVEFEAVCRDPDDLYDLMEILRADSVTVVSSQNKSPDLEEAFVEIVDNERSATTPGSKQPATVNTGNGQ